MKKRHWMPGIIVSLGISFIAALPRVIRMEKFDINPAFFVTVYNFLFCISCWVSHQYILSFKKNLNSISPALLAAGSIALAGPYTFIMDSLISIFDAQPLLIPEVTGSKRVYVLLLRGLLIGGLMYFIAYYLYILEEKQKNSLEIEQLKRAQLAANLSSLKEQLSPHFLFNTLNTLSTLTKEETVKNYVSELANVYRYVLQYKEMDTATMQQELSFIQSYLYIIKTRLEESIEVNIQVDKSILSSKIPPLTLQLLIENAIKHNIASSSKQLRIELKNTADGFFTVGNNLQPKSAVQNNSTGIGLDNVMQRYRLLFNKEIIIEKKEASFIVKLPIA